MTLKKIALVSSILFVIFMFVSFGYKIYSMELLLKEKDIIIDRQATTITTLEFSNYGYEQFIERKILDGELIEINKIDRGNE